MSILFSDDYSGTVINTDNYAPSASGVTQNDALLFASGAANWSQGIISKASYNRSQELTIEFDLRCTAAGYIMAGWHENNITNYNFNAAPHYIYLPNSLTIRRVDENSSVDTGVAWAVGTQYRFKIVPSTSAGAVYYYSTNGGTNYTALGTSSVVTTTPMKFGVSYYGGSFTLDNLEINGTPMPYTQKSFINLVGVGA